MKGRSDNKSLSLFKKLCGNLAKPDDFKGVVRRLRLLVDVQDSDLAGQAQRVVLPPFSEE
jgi:hypothetical protein